MTLWPLMVALSAARAQTVAGPLGAGIDPANFYGMEQALSTSDPLTKVLDSIPCTHPGEACDKYLAGLKGFQDPAAPLEAGPRTAAETLSPPSKGMPAIPPSAIDSAVDAVRPFADSQKSGKGGGAAVAADAAPGYDADTRLKVNGPTWNSLYGGLERASDVMTAGRHALSPDAAELESAAQEPAPVSAAVHRSDLKITPNAKK